jgi:acyl-CoA thioesterase
VGNPFLDGTVVRRVEAGRWAGHIDEVWNLRPLPQGGLVTAIALRAMAAELDDPDQTLRVAHTTFAAQVASGPVEVDVELLRRGRSMSHLRAEVRNEGAPRGHLTTGIFGQSRRGYDFTDLVPPPDVPHPDDCPSFRDPPPPEFERTWEPMPFWEEVMEGLPVVGHPPWEDYEPDRAEVVQWYRFDDPPMLDDGTLDPFAFAVAVDMMPSAAGERIGPGQNEWFAPSVDLTLHVLDDARSGTLLAHNRCRHAGDGYASADMALWDYGPDQRDEPRLVAYGCQVFLFSFVD